MSDNKTHLPTWHIESINPETRRKFKALQAITGKKQPELVTMMVDAMWRDFFLTSSDDVAEQDVLSAPANGAVGWPPSE